MFITFEGTEGCGKSTLIRNLSARLQKLGVPHLVTREPGGTRTAEKIRKIILNEEMDPLTELFLYEAARAEHFKTTVAPALKQGHWVLCDRFTDSTLAYQGYARGIPLHMIRTLNRIASQKRSPDLTLFLDLPVEIGLERASDPNRFEREGVEFQKKVRKGFLEIAKKEKARFRVIRVTDLDADQVCEKAMGALKKHLRKYL
jgi:dTMP kinase